MTTELEDRLIQAVREIGPCTCMDAKRRSGVRGVSYDKAYRVMSSLVARGQLTVGKSGPYNVYEIPRE